MKACWVCVRVLAWFCCITAGARLCEAKVIQGAVSSLQAWEEKGQFVAKFCFHDRQALFQYSTNGSSSNGGRWIVYLDNAWPSAVVEQDCQKRVAMAKFTMDLVESEGSQHINQWKRPHFWFVVYADDDTCGDAAPSENHVIEYELTFLNPDSGGDATDHFGEDQRGLLVFYCLLLVLYCAGTALYAHWVWITVSKGAPMHEVLKVLSCIMAVHFFSAFFMMVHLWRFSSNGHGFPFLETLSELLEIIAQCLMVWLLLSMSVGWTLSSHYVNPMKDTKQLVTTAAVVASHVIIVLWEQSYQESEYTYHVHESLPGRLLVLFRLSLAGLFGYNLKQTISMERSTLRRDFYQTFSIWCYLWFLSFPTLIVIAMVFAEYWKHWVVTVGVTVIQSAAMALLARLFLTRSLYWEVSTLSSHTLPLKRDRGGGLGPYYH